MARKVYLDCTKLVRGTRWGMRMIPRLRQYCGSCFADFNRIMSDESLFAYLYAKSTNSNPASELVLQRTGTDYVNWVNGEPAPDYMCSWLRTALQDRLHYPVQACQKMFA